ncbi:metal ABC transporter solute-binding protein, Zn/Mn family [Helicobacter burdigaliensis]|uniref:metal ABC transporter solute-binding protein, Zn/Mn family n=1 Tax=Helicobacter burdigaliensis TaxID=2315334 RepID=UPI000EF6D66A|nr:zinc ABC transporter substrate-binding protein [Helicobacter burdigaliensis]
MYKFLFFLLFCLSFLEAKPIVSVSIPPQAYFVKQIAKDSVEINILIAPNSDEHNFDFKLQDALKLSKSDLFFRANMDFENTMLDKFQNLFSNLTLVDTNANITLLSPSNHHSHHHFDPHTWLDPNCVKIQAKNILEALSQKYPQNKEFYQANYLNFIKELEALDSHIKTTLTPLKTRQFIVYHPSWSYFAKAYDLVQLPVEINGKEPKPKELLELIKKAKENNIKAVFVQPGFPKNATETLAKELDAKVVQINHLSRDWKNELLKTTQSLADSLK